MQAEKVLTTYVGTEKGLRFGILWKRLEDL